MPYDDGSSSRIVLDGPAVPLAPRVAGALGMAAHELTTNAAQHGSLSVPEGRVRVRWELTTNGDGTGSRTARDWGHALNMELDLL